MNDFNIRITRRTEFGDRAHEQTIDIDCSTPNPPSTLLVTSAAPTDPSHDAHVPGDATEMAEALGTLSQELGCANTLDDMLHAVDALRGTPTAPQLEWSATLCDAKRVNHAAAEKACAAHGEGWRLPTRAELLSLVDDTRSDPAIDTTRFPDTQSGAYWTSTPLASGSSCAWIVHFNYGYADGYHRGSGYAFVRAVRASSAGQ